jgi:predicted nucleic acid-binding protein
MRAVIDTNVWVSAVLNPHGAPAQVMDAFRKQFLKRLSPR